MTFENLLKNRCDIERFTEAAVDDYGIPVKVWAFLYEDEPCRHISGKGREVKVGSEVHIIYDQLFVGDLDVTAQDRVIINGLTYNIIDLVFRQDNQGDHHKQLYLEIVK